MTTTAIPKSVCTDEWAIWQQGRCGIDALALMELDPSLRLGSLDNGVHFFAHDDEFAYDSGGRHRLPYVGIDGTLAPCDLDQDPRYWGLPDDAAGLEGPEPHLTAAKVHAKRNGVLEGRCGLDPVAAPRHLRQ